MIIVRHSKQIACVLAFAVLGSFASRVAAAPVSLGDGRPDPNCSDLSLWLRADAGVKDEAGRGPEDPAFSGLVAAWNDQSPRHFDLTATADSAPMFVPRQNGAGNRPTVAFGAGRLLARTSDALHEQAQSTMLIVLQVEPGSDQGQFVFCAGEPNGHGERLGFISTDSNEGGRNSLRWLTPADNGEFVLDDTLHVPTDGRFAIVIVRSAGESSTVEIQDGLGDALDGNREMVPRGRIPRSDACGRGFVLGGTAHDQRQWSYDGQIAEMMVYKRALTSAERLRLVAYLRRKYALDVLDALAPADTLLVQAEDFDGSWEISQRWDKQAGYCLGRRHVTANGRAADEGIKRTVQIARAGSHSVWVRAIAARRESALRTVVNGQPLGVTHDEKRGGMCWQSAGTIDLSAGEAEIVVRGEGSGYKECDAVLVGPANMTLDEVESHCALARRLREMPGAGQLSALFADGRRIEGNLVSGFRGSGLSLGHEANRPALRCLALDCEASEPLAAEPVLEFRNGDRLRGTILGPAPALPDSDRPTPGQLLVQTFVDGVKKAEQPITIDGDWLSRVVFEASETVRAMPPRSLVCRDGRFITFRGLRWTGDGVSVLTAQGIERIAYRDLAQVELSPGDVWDAYYRQLAAIDPELRGEIVRLETSDGMLLTSSASGVTARRAATEGAASICLLRTAWSSTPVPVAWSAVHTVWRAPATVVRLSQVVPQKVAQPSGLGGSWRWQADHNVAGGELQSGGNRYLWGFGVHAPNAMTFALPDSARAMQTSIGIDAAVGNSGYVVAKVYANAASGTPLYQCQPLAGSRTVVSTGEMALARNGAAVRQLVLAVDGGGPSRGASADPLDIGDHVDWLEPVLLLDSAKLREAIKKVQLPKDTH